jgi:hypothetical protein
VSVRRARSLVLALSAIVGALTLTQPVVASSHPMSIDGSHARAAGILGDPVIAAGGDIACDPADTAFKGGDGTLKTCRMKAVSDLLVAGNYAAVLEVGDEQYECAGPNAFLASYDPTWGRVNAISHPVIGNHEYYTSGGTDCGPGGAGYQQYFTNAGVGVGTSGQFWYSFDVGTWHIIALNANCSKVSCKTGSLQDQWLKTDLASHSNTCTLAFWHQPRFSSGTTGSVVNYKGMAPLWNDLVASRADIAISGHRHWYERLGKMDANGAASATGLVQWIVGTGGKSLARNGGSAVYPTRQFFDAQHYGFLELTLHPTSYDWRFITDSGTVTDSGSDTCSV